MKAKLTNGNLLLKAENKEEEAWIRQASRFNFMRNIAASTGAPPNWLELNCASGFHAYELTSLLKELSKKLEVVNQAFLVKESNDPNS